MVNVKKNIKNFSNYIKHIAFDGVILTVILGFIALVLISNISRVVIKAYSNYQVYVYEQETLETLKNKNDELKTELSYVKTDEYKRLALRDSLNLVQNYENLYQTEKKFEYYKEPSIKFLDLNSKQDYKNWWEMLIK